MFYSTELSFLCEVFQKIHLNTDIIEENELKNTSLKSNLDRPFHCREFISSVFNMLHSYTVYRLTDSYGCCYRFLLLPEVQTPTILCVGPYLTSQLSSNKVFEICEENGLSPTKHRYLSEYYSGLPVLPDDCHMLIMFDTFCEAIWKNRSFKIKDISNNASIDIPLSHSVINEDFDNVLFDMKVLERRYSYENEMIHAVEMGQPHIENQLSAVFSADFFERRIPDQLRNAKNYAIIMNTLLRKAAEKGGVHPLHIDKVSSGFAMEIENLSSFSGVMKLMSKMFRTYCKLVQDNSTQRFSSLVQKTILMIESNLSAELSTNVLAKKQGVSLGYLSGIFKKETGKTVSEYIRIRRMEHAIYLLKTTKLQIQTVALYCGIVDVQYFSKIFKKHTGKTPTEYRCSLNDV